MDVTRARLGMLVSALLIAAAYLTSGSVVSAQVSAAILGRIEDASGAAMPGTTVTITNDETGAARTVIADAGGNYEVLSLPVGRYNLKADKPGFKTSIETSLDLVVGQQAVVNLKMEVGEVQQTVTVSGEAPVVNTTTAAISGLVGEQEVKDLPLNGRSFDNLITLNAGAINYSAFTSDSASGAGGGNSFVVVGRRSSENLFLMNGVEYTSDSERSLEPGGASGQLLGIDAVREFNVLTDTYSAQYGKRPGAQVAVITQSGSNVIHGTLFEFLRNSHLDARNYFDASPSQLGHRIPEFQRNQFGGAVGGPMRKDKAFAFLNYEGFRQRLGVSDVSIVPDNNARLGFLPNAQGVETKVAGLNTGMLPFFALWPQPNGAVLGAGLAINTSSPKQSIREDFATVRFDQNLSSKDTLSESATFDDGHNVSPQLDPIFDGIYKIRDQIISVQESHIFSSEKVNTIRVGYSRGDFNFNTPPAVPLPANLSFVAGLEPGTLTVGGGIQAGTVVTTVTPAGSKNDYLSGARNLYTYADDFQLVKGKHQLSFGVWFQRMDENDRRAPNMAGSASFSTLTTLLQGTVNSFQAVPNPHEEGYRLWMGAWYVSDTIKLRSNLTLTAGLRHEFTNTLSEAHNQIGNFVFTGSGANLVYVTVPVVPLTYTENNGKWLFGPRVALAWDVFGNGKTAIRSGFGTFYSVMDGDLYGLDADPPFNGIVSLGAKVPFLPLIPVPRGITGPPQCNVGVPQPCTTYGPKGLYPTIKTPTVQEWNLTVEQQITSSTAFRAAYLGSHGYHATMSADFNTLHPLTCSSPAGCTSGGLNTTTGTVPMGTLYIPAGESRPNPFLGNSGGVHDSLSDSDYAALQLELTQRLRQGLQFRANFTWSKNMNISAEGGGTQSTNSASGVMEPYNVSADWGPSSSDVTNAASISGSYDLPIGHGKPWLGGMNGIADKLASGWQVNSIVTLLSGFPFDPQIGANQSGNGDNNNPDRPSWNPAFTGPIITGNPNQWYNPNAFIIPVSGTWGNVSRNALRGPGLANWDMSLFKTTSLTERTTLQFRAEIFNIVNHTNFGFPDEFVFSGTAISTAAGVITNTVTTSRQIQFGLKLIY